MTAPGYCDSHLHLEEIQKAGLIPQEELAKAREKSVIHFLDVGLTETDIPSRIKNFGSESGLHFAAGLCPWETNGSLEKRVDSLAHGIKTYPISAIGEIGLEYAKLPETKVLQQQIFDLQLDLAKQLRLPVLIHNREADDDIHAHLFRHKAPSAGIIHCFSSDWDFAIKMMDLGFMISFAGNITYKNAVALQDTARRIPLSHLLIETDSPYLSPRHYRGQKNVPSYIIETYKFIAELQEIEIHDLTQAVEHNFLKVLRLQQKEKHPS